MITRMYDLCKQFFLVERRAVREKNNPFRNQRQEKRINLINTVETFLYSQTLENLKTFNIYGEDAVYSHATVCNCLLGIEHKADQLLFRQQQEDLTMDTLVYEMLNSPVLPKPIRQTPELLIDYTVQNKRHYIEEINARKKVG